MKKVVSCLNLHRLHSSEFNESWSRDVYVVNRCPSSVGNEQVAALCAKGSHEDSEAFLRLPVYGRRSLAFYMNVYCAACNGDTDVVYLKVEKICTSKVFSSMVIIMNRALTIFIYKGGAVGFCDCNIDVSHIGIVILLQLQHFCSLHLGWE